MKHKKIIVPALMALGVVLLTLQVNNISAGKNPNLREELISRINSGQITTPFPPVDITPTVFPEGGMDDLPTVESRILQVSSEQVAINEAVLESARELIGKANDTYRTPGWWHTAYQVFYLARDGNQGTMPNGLPMPTEWREDHWILVDEKGFIIKSVDIVDSGSAETSQIGVYSNGVSKNLTFSLAWEEPPQLATLGNGFLEWIENDIGAMVLESQEEILDDESVIVFTNHITMREPEETKPGYWVSSGNNIYYFSRETGFTLLFELYDIFPNGQTKLTHRVKTLVVEQIKEPPAEIMKYLE